ncbi:potassium/proton antiporter [Azospirillum picis]|uniref:Cell volume regulation protein A n=1 Tax=Azospirillum picis TaxID=488438 RepID=A0ABU0MTS6_9PROT|nr:potassium/proton antiporter [Azospirillum picis]MBP2303120.1 cell volume regulation protein A [Azospirillum picis]MDQ0536872.1 cell volume regulation protein A [Azospirillum picis]
MEAVSYIILIGSSLLIASVLTSYLALRVGAPLLLIFLGIGLLAGEDGIGGISFNDPQAAFLIGSMALAVILFESGFDTKLASYKAAAGPALSLATLGVTVTTGVVGLGAHSLLGLGWVEALLVGAACSSTDAAAVFFLLRVGGITLRDRVRSTLEIESGSNDPVAIMLTILLVEAAGHGFASPVAIVSELVLAFALGGVMGLAGGWLLVAFINKARFEAGLNPVVTLTFALFVFAATNMLGGSGYLAVYVAGLYAGNVKLRGALELRRFHAGLTWLSQIVMFVMLGLFATPRAFVGMALPALGIAVLLVLVARPLAVWLCLLPFRFSVRETSFIAWVGLRGAVSLLLALVPVLGGLEHGQLIFNTAFIVVVVSLLVQGWTIGAMARVLDLIVPPRRGPVERVELELPGNADQELVAYTVHGKSPAARGQRLPRWARPSLVIRAGAVVPLHKAKPLQTGDHVYLFTPQHRLPLIDRLYGGSRALDQNDREFYGDLALSPDATVEQIAEMYGLPLSLANARLPLRDLLRNEFGGAPELGDRVRMGGVELIVRDMDDDGITSVGLALEPARVTQPRRPLYRRLDAIGGLLRDWWRHRSFQRWKRREKQRGRRPDMQRLAAPPLPEESMENGRGD